MSGIGLALVAALAATGLAATAVAVPADLPLTLEEARARALARNPEMRIERASLGIADSSVERAKGSYDLSLRADARYRDRTDPVNSILSGAPSGEVGPSTYGGLGNVSLSKLLPTGGTVALSSSVGREQTNNTFGLLTPSYTTSLGLEVRQPLLANRAIDPARRGLSIARIDRSRSVASLARVASETVAAVERAYWTLAAAGSDVEARTSAVALAERQRDDVTARIEAGTQSEADAAAPLAELERRKGELLAAKEARARAENGLKALLTDDPADPIWEARVAPGDLPEAAPEPPHDLEAALAEARTQRPEVAEAAARLERIAVDEKAARNRVLPQLDLVAGLTARGLAGSENPGAVSPAAGPINVPPELVGSLGRSYETLFEGRFPDASIGLAFVLPVGNRVAKADAAIAASQREQASVAAGATRLRVEVEVRNAAVARETARQRVEAARASRRAAETLLLAESERFDAGVTTSFFVLTRQNDLTAARIAETAALADSHKALVEWARARGALLRERGIRIEDDAPAPKPAGGPR